MAEMARAMEEHAVRERKVEAFAAHGLCLAPSMPDELIQEVIRRYESKNRSVGILVLGFYRRDDWSELKKAVQVWRKNRFFAQRMQIIEDALWAHMNRRYTLSVPTLTPQVEGLIWDWLSTFCDSEDELKKIIADMDKSVARNRNSSTEYGRNIVGKVIGNMAANSLTSDNWLRMKTLVAFANNYLLRPYKIQREHAKYRRSNVLSRHAIAHGSGLRSGTAINSLRLFLALDVLALVN
jgi:hypothetical protein